MSTAPWLIMLGLVAVAMFWILNWQRNTGTRVDYSYFIDQVEHKNVKSVKAYGDILTGKLKKVPANLPPEVSKFDEQLQFNANIPDGMSKDKQFWDELRKNGVNIDAEAREPSYAQQTIFWLVGSVALIFFLIYMMRRNVDPLSGGMMGNFIRSQAKRFQPSDQRTTFEDVAALDQAKIELQEIVEFLKTPAKFNGWALDPQGRLAHGASGNGKNPAGPGRRGRGRGAVFLDQRLGIHPDVRRRGRLARPRPVPHGEGELALHPVHRRDRRGGPRTGGRLRRRTRRAGADPQSDLERDGRLPADRSGDRAGRHQPPRRARSGVAASRPV